ncbi:MAG: hypothetical protein ACLFQB_14600 [Chitinispirillaceae bacterium]
MKLLKDAGAFVAQAHLSQLNSGDTELFEFVIELKNPVFKAWKSIPLTQQMNRLSFSEK